MAKKDSAAVKKDDEVQTDDQQTDETLSLGDELRAAFAQDQEQTDDETKTDDDTQTDETEDDDETETKEVTDEASTEETETTTTTEEETKEVEAVELPDNFSDEDRAAFDGLPEASQQWLLGRHNSFLADYTKKTQAIAEFRKTYEPVAEVLEPHRQMMMLNGMTPAQLIGRWSAAEQYLQTKPVEAIRWLAGNYGVSPDTLIATEDQDDAYVDPEVQALRKDVANLRQTVDQRTQQDTLRVQQTNESAVAEFIDAKDESGKPLHPHASNSQVLEKMTQLATATGNADLNDLYETAVLLVPETKKQVMAAAQGVTTSAAQKDAAKKAARAKKASKSVSTSPTTKADTAPEKMSVRENLEKAFGDAGGVI